MSDQRLPVSVLDTMPVWEGSSATQSLHNAVELAAAVERLGYTRYWVAEHHNTPSVASSAPTLMISQIAARTSKLRVGSGGVMLPNHPPLIVAEQFSVLSAFYPGRIDLGVGRAPGTDPLTAGALRRPATSDFPEQLKELEHYLDSSHEERGTALEIKVTPPVESRPPVFLLGSSASGAQLAASRGLPFAFAHHLRPDATVEAVRVYREQFVPSELLSEPYALAASFVIAADTAEEATFQRSSLLMAMVMGKVNPFIRFTPPEIASQQNYTAAETAPHDAHLRPQLIGDPAAVQARLAELVERTGVDEVMAVTPIFDHGARVRSHEILMDAVRSL
jgi:luciferase family oxidoreductase group 1